MDDKPVKIYKHPNPEIVSFLTTTDIFPPRAAFFANRESGAAGDILEGLDSIEARMVIELLALPGVKEMRVKPKEIRMTKHASYSWEKITSAALRVIETSLRRKSIKPVRR